ncbi:22043_t:CDS:1, partial [Gigaspora margarita]
MKIRSQNTSDYEDDAADNNSSSSSQYFATFKRNNHGETIIDHMIDNDDMIEDNLLI